MRRPALAIILTVLSGCATTAPDGPTAAEFSALMPDHAVRAVRCTCCAEEGSEWGCRYLRRTPDGGWERRDAVVARDGETWILIDG